MTRIERNPEEFASDRYDVIVIGGGIYGACTLLEASRRGLRALLLERDDFGGATSWNSLRIIHGGLRYLQTADLRRFRRSVAEQAWWLQNFPDCVRPLSCLMPLYNQGLRRASAMQAALFANDALAGWIRRPYGVSLDSGQIISSSETQSRFPMVRKDGLRAGALWSDAMMNSPQRTLIEVLRWATSAGGRALNYVKAEGIETDGNNKVRGVVGRCQVTHKRFDYVADLVVNCSGPWVSELTENASPRPKTEPKILRQNAMARAYNICVSRPLVKNEALAVTSDRGSTYFCVPHDEGQRTLIGTIHLPPSKDVEPTEAELSMFVNDFRTAVPAYELSLKDIDRVLPGRLPPSTNGSHLPSKSPRIVLSRKLVGLVSVEGVKYTTARRIAEKALILAFQSSSYSFPSYQNVVRPTPALLPPLTHEAPASDLLDWIKQESVVHLDDLLLRRTDHLVGTAELRQLAENVLSSTDWNEAKRRKELTRISNGHGNCVLKTQQDAQHDQK